MAAVHKVGLGVREAIRAAKVARPIIDPIGRFPELLKRYEAARAAGVEPVARASAAAQAVPAAPHSPVAYMFEHLQPRAPAPRQ